MGKQRLSAGGYDVLTEDPRDAQRTADLRKFRLRLDQEEANKRRDDALKQHLSGYKDDPIAQALATAEFYAKEEDAQKAAEQAEYDSIVSQHDDPVAQGLAVAKHYAQKMQAPAAQQAFAESERLGQLKEQEQNARKLENFPLGLGEYAGTREIVGAAVNVVPKLAGTVARAGEAVGLIPEKAADELYRESGRFGQAREEARQDDLAPYLSRMYGGAAESLLQMAGTPGGAYSKIAGSGIMSGSEALTTAEDAGLKGADRLRYAGTQGLLEAGIAAIGQRLFGGGLESRLAGQTVAAQTWKALGKSLGMDALKEMPEEVVTTILQDLSSKYEKVSPDLTFGDFVANSVDAAVQAAMMSGMAGAPAAGKLLAKGFTKTPAELRAEGIPPDPATSDRTAPAAGPGFETPVLKNPAIDAFIAKPESKNTYDAAVAAGMTPLPNPNRKERAKYAADLQQMQQAPPRPSPADPATQAPAALEPTAPPQETVQDDELSWFEQQLGEDRPIPESASPAGTQPDATPAESQDVRTPAAHTKESFEKEYLDTKAKFEQTEQGTPEHEALRIRMDALFKTDPYFADEIEKRKKPPGAETGGASPGQPMPPAAGPVSIPDTAIAKTITEATRDVQPEDEDGWRLLKKPIRATVKYENKEPFQVDVRGYNPSTGDVDAWHPTKRNAFADVKISDLVDETPVATGVPSPGQPATEAAPVSKPELPEYASIHKGDDGLFYPNWSKPGKLPQTAMMGFKTEHEAAEWFKPRTKPPGKIPSAEPPKGAIGWNNQGLPIYESKTGLRTVGDETEQAASLKTPKQGTPQAVLSGPREDRFKTEAELQKPEHTQFHSGLSRSPAEVDEAIASGNGVGVSAFESLSTPIRKKLVDYANADGNVFIDSGAFSALMKNTTIDWDKVLFSYHEMVSSVAEDKRRNVSIVAPDIVGDHAATMDLQFNLREKFEPFLESGATVIFPVQKGGHENLSGNFADLTYTFGDLMESVTLGVPFNAKAWSQDDVLEFMRNRDQQAKVFGGPVRPFHLLGGGPSKVEKLFEAAKAEGLSTEGVSADAMPKKISQRRGGKAPVPAFAALPQKSQDLFNKAFESNDVDSLKQMVDKNNLAWNAEWESRTGNKLPRALKARHQAVLDWVGPQATPEPSATEHDRLYKELQPLYRDPKHKAGDREHMKRIRDLEQQVEFHKPAAVARAQAEIDAEAAKKPTAFAKRADTPMWGIYQTLFQGKPKFAVKESDKGFGDAMFDDEAEAKKHAAIGRQRSEERAAQQAKAQADEEAAQKKQQEHEASFQGFLTDDPKTKGRRLKTLDSSLNYKDKPTTRKALVEQKVADGWTVNDKDQLQAPTGEFLDERDLTKTGIDYARHLVNKSSESTQAVPWRRTAEEERPAYNRRLKKEGWTASPKPSISALDSPGAVKAISLEKVKKSPYKKGDRVIVHTGFSTDEMHIGGEVIEDSLPESQSVKVRVDSGKVHYVAAYYLGRAEKPVAPEPEAKPAAKPQEPTPKAEKPEKTLRGQTLIPGMPGRAEEIDEQQFVSKHRTPFLDQVEEVSDDKGLRDAMVEPMSEILKSVWSGELKAPPKDNFDDLYGDDLWVTLASEIAYHAPSRMEATIEEMADQTIRKAFKDYEKVKDLKALRKAEREAYEQVKQFEADGIAQLLEHGEEAGVRAANAGEPDKDFTEKEADEIIDSSFDLGTDAIRVGDLVLRRGKTGVVVRVRPDGKLTVEFETTMASGRTVKPRYSSLSIIDPDDYVKVGTAPFPVTLEQFYAQFGEKDAIQIVTEFMSTWDLLSSDDKSRFAHKLRKFGIPGAKANNKASKIAESVANVVIQSKGVPGKIREVYDIASEYPNLQGNLEDTDKANLAAEMWRRIDRVGLHLGPMIRAAMILPEMRRDLLYDLAKTQFGRDIAEAMFDEADETAPADSQMTDIEAAMAAELDRLDAEEAAATAPKAPKAAKPPKATKAPKVVTRPDMTVTGQYREIPGREGVTYAIHHRKPDVIPDTFRAYVTSSSPGVGGFLAVDGTGMTAEAAYDKALAEFDRQLKARKPPRTAVGEKLGKKAKEASEETKKAFENLLNIGKKNGIKTIEDLARDESGSINTEVLTATAQAVRAAVKSGVLNFADFVMQFVEYTSPETARAFSDYLEAAWKMIGQRKPDLGLDSAGSVADILGPETEVSDEDSERHEPTGDGARDAAERPLGEGGMEETSSDDVSTDAEGGDAGRRGTPGSEGSGGETSGTVSDGDEGTGSVPDGAAGDDRPAGRSGRLDYRITGEDRIGEKFHPKERFDKNVAAIKVLKQIEAENRRATPEEQKVLAQYVGWGGLKEAFSTRADQGLREKAILKDLLTEQELAQARTSVRNAHYTSPEVISAMWEGLTDAGFAGGRILEPSSGIGHFYGLVPESVAEVSKLSGIEMDSLTARIAKQLYQTADITHAPYQDVNVKNLQDLVISNVPFGPYKAKDKYNKDLKKKTSIHNFFFLKAMTNVRPGGVIAFITSRYTMDGRTAEHMDVREKIAAAGGRFVGAVRLPNNAFMGIAKTKVTTDVIFIQKEAGDAQPWLNTKESADGFVFNEYFHEHPENVLGKIDPKGGTQIGEWGIAPDGHDIGKELAQKIAAMPFDRSAMAENSTENDEATEDIGEDADVKDGRLSIRGGKLYRAVGGKLEPIVLWGGDRGQERKFEIIRSMANLAAVRDKLSELETSPLATDDQIERARKQLNTAYDRFVTENGFVHKAENKGLFQSDEQLPTLLALEEWDTDTKTAKKAEVFEKRVQRPPGSEANPTTAEGAAVESYARLGRIDLPMISDWLGKPESQVEAELTGWAYKDPASGEWFLKNVYLSGNIAKKLKEAEAAAKKNPAFQKNVEDLKRVLPPRKKAGEIHVRPRSPFITPAQYTQFMQHIGVGGVLRHDDFTGSWQLDNPHIEDPVKAGPWGVAQKDASDLFEGLLNNKPPVIWGKDYNGDRVVNHAATQLARAKAKEIEDEFGRWIFTDPERAKQIEDGFNDTVGAFIEGEWDGSHLTLPGMNINITLMPHQKNAIWRAIVTGNIMLAHEVGLGKTWIMAAIAMERRRLGLATNQMFVVPNHLLSQWASEFKALYPSAKLLALESDQINSENRRTLMERVKSGRFDAIIVTPEAYKKMPMSNEIVQAKLNEITQKIEDTIKAAKKAKGENKNFVAKLESVLESIRGKMEVMLNDPAKDAGAKFDDLGIDAIYVDEAHEYRNLWSMTQMGDISGVGLNGNQKTFDMLLKTDYLNQKTNNRGIVFATGTPIANSISELYSMQRYLQPHTLAEAGVASFDDWANTFGEAVTDIEVDPTGSGFRSKTRFKEFRNTIALSKIFRQVADVKYAEDVGLDKVRPKLRGGKLHAIQVMPSLGLLGYVRDLVRRLEISKKRSFDKRIDNPLKVTTDGRKAALDMRLVVPEEDGISSKINHAVENVARIHREEGERKGAQLLWVNLGTPASAKKGKKKASDVPDQESPDPDSPDAQMDNEEAALESGRINAYEDIKQKLITQGIPENEIAFIHDHDSKDRKRALFQKVRDGKVRILISTVKKLATGANIQTRLAAMHFLDPPWKPADIEQALGRAIRRGNKYKDWGGVQAFTYVTRGSFDAYIWQLLENKAKAIKQIMRGESDSVEDTGRIELNADEVKALASSNPKVLELVKVRNEVGQLQAEYYGYRQEQANIQSGIAHKVHTLDYRKRYLKSIEDELKTMPSRDDLHSDFKVTIGKKTYSKRSEVGRALIEAMPLIDWKDEAKSKEQVKELSANPVKIGSAYGKPLFAGRSDYDNSAKIIIGQKDGDYFKPSEDETGTGVKLFNYFDAKYDEPSRIKANIKQEEQELKALQQRAGQEWPKEGRLQSGRESLRILEAELGSNAGQQGQLPVVSALTKFAIMAEKLGRQTGRPVTFDGDQWMHGDRTPVKQIVTKEMEAEVDAEVLLLLRDSDEDPQEGFFFNKNNVPEFRSAAEKARQELKKFQLLNTKYNKIIVNEWKRIGRASTPWTGIPLSAEMTKAIAGRMLGAIRAGVKRFEVFVLELLEDPELSKDIIIGIKPRLIGTWNAAKERYSLDDEATEEVFDAAIEKHADTEIQEALESAQAEAGPPAGTPDPAAMATPERTYSTKNAFSAAERERLGIEERPPVERQPREPSIDRAKALGQTKHGENRINALISELSVRPRAVTPEENDLLLFRNADLGERLETALRQLNAARKSGDDTQEAIADTTVRNLTAEKKTLIELILEPIGTEAGRALQARKAVVDQDFTLVRQVLLFEAAHGRAPDTEGHTGELDAMQKQIDDLQASMAELKKLTDAQSAENADLKTKLKEAHDALANAPSTPAAHTPPTPAPVPSPITPTEKTRKEKAREKVDNVYAKIRGLLNKKYSIETATAETLAALTELAAAYVELGVVSVGDFLSRIKKRMGPEADKLIPLAKQAWRNVTSATMDDVLNRITSKIDPMDDDTIGRAARDLHRFVIDRDGLDASAEGREAAVDAVHQILVDIIPELTIDQTARAMSGIGIYSPLSDDEIEAIRRDQKAQLLLIEQVMDWRKAAIDEANQPGSGKGPPATGLERPPVSDEQRALRKLVNDAKKAAGIVTATAGQLRSALDAAKRLARNRITDLNEALKPGGKPIAKNQKILRTDTELDALREERDRLQKLYDAAFGKNTLSNEQRLAAAEKALDRAISDLEADLASGKLYKDTKKPRLTSHAIEAKRAALEALKANRDEMRIQSGEAEARSDAAYKRHLLERDAELARRLAAGEFQPAAKKKERVLTPSMLKVMQSIDKQQKEILKKRKEWIFQNRHPVHKFLVKGVVGPLHALRKGLTTFDESLIGRQGYLLGITHPKIYAKAIRKGFAENPLEAKSIFPTEQDLFNTEAALDADLNWVRLEKIGKVAVTGVHGGMNREEGNQYVPEWFDKTPGIGGSERAGSGVINTQRRLVFRSLVEKLATTVDGKRSISNAELRIIGNAVNVASGRGSLGKWANSLEALTLVFFSPRWWISRLAWWAGQPVWHESRWFGGEGASKEVRILVAKEWAKQAAAQAAIMSLAIAGLMAAFGDPGDDEEWDWYGNPISPEFGKLRIGSTMVDMTAGLGQHMSLFARLFSGKEIRRWEGVQDVDALRVMGSHERGKLAPIPSMTVDYFVGKSIDQKPVLSGEWFLSRMAPLIATDVWEAVQQEGPATGAALAALMFFGIGANTREKRVKERTDIANELRAMQKQKQPPEKIQKALNDHLKHTAGMEAKEDLRTADPEDAPALEKVVAGTDSAELAEAIEKEKFDLTLRALERLSTEPGIGEKGAGEDKAIGDARSLLKAIAPTYEEANALFGRAYMQQNGPLTEIVGRAGEKRRVTKKNVVAARRRLKAIYAD